MKVVLRKRGKVKVGLRGLSNKGCLEGEREGKSGAQRVK